MKSKYGAEIDSAEAVFRVNLHPITKENSAYLGTKSTFRVIDHTMFTNLVGEGYAMKQYDRTSKVKTLQQLISEEKCTVIGSCVAAPLNDRSALVWTCSDCVKAFKARISKAENFTSDRLHIISPEIENAFFKSMGVYGSQTGALTMMLTQPMCETVRVYGMSELSRTSLGQNNMVIYNSRETYGQKVRGPSTRIFAWQEIMGLIGKVIFRR